MESLSSDVVLIIILWILVFSERLFYIFYDPSQGAYMVADSKNYLQSGLDFARTGMFLYRGHPTALIMPGMQVLIGTISLIFRETSSFTTALQIVWVFMGSFVPVYLYRSLRLFTRKSCAFLTSLIYLFPWHMEIDRFLLTECPYYLFFSIALFYMLRIGKYDKPKDIWRYAFAILGALLFRANILIFILFSFLYWLLVGQRSIKVLSRRLLVIVFVLGLFLVPWTIRNAKVFHSFIPVTYGAGNPVYEGTYQGENPPTDEEIGHVFPGHSVYAAIAEKRPDLVDAEGNVSDPNVQQYVDHLVSHELARIRLSGWWKLRPLGLLKSYLLVKPRIILNWVWYYTEVFGFSYQAAHRIRQLGFIWCLITLILARKRLKKQVWFLFITYLINLLIISSSLAIDRYAQMIMPYRYLIMGLGLELLLGYWDSFRNKNLKGQEISH